MCGTDEINCQHILIHLNLLILPLYLVLHTYSCIHNSVRAQTHTFTHIHRIEQHSNDKIPFHCCSFLTCLSHSTTLPNRKKSATIKFLERRKIYINYTLFLHRFCGGVEKTTQVEYDLLLLYMFNELLLLHCSSTYIVVAFTYQVCQQFLVASIIRLVLLLR